MLTLKEKINQAIKIMRDYEPPVNGYWLAFSGGKDSCVLKHLARKSGVKFEAVYNWTGLDYPETISFMREQHEDVR